MWLILSTKKYAPWNEQLWANLCSSWDWTEIEGLTYCSKASRVWLYEKFTTEIYHWFHWKWKCFGWAFYRRASSVLTQCFTGWCYTLLMKSGRNLGVVIGRTAVFKATAVGFGLVPSPGPLWSVLGSWNLIWQAGSVQGQFWRPLISKHPIFLRHGPTIHFPKTSAHKTVFYCS